MLLVYKNKTTTEQIMNLVLKHGGQISQKQLKGNTNFITNLMKLGYQVVLLKRLAQKLFGQSLIMI